MPSFLPHFWPDHLGVVPLPNRNFMSSSISLSTTTIKLATIPLQDCCPRPTPNIDITLTRQSSLPRPTFNHYNFPSPSSLFLASKLESQLRKLIRLWVCLNLTQPKSTPLATGHHYSTDPTRSKESDLNGTLVAANLACLHYNKFAKSLSVILKSFRARFPSNSR